MTVVMSAQPQEVFPSLQQWSEMGRAIIARAEAATWDLADWAAMATQYRKEGAADQWHTLQEFCQAHRLNYGYTRNCGSVARKFPKSCRHDKLKFGHHWEVCAVRTFDDLAREKWLCRAEKESLSCADLRKLIRQSLGSESAIEDAPKGAFGFGTLENYEPFHDWLWKLPSETFTPEFKQNMTAKLEEDLAYVRSK